MAQSSALCSLGSQFGETSKRVLLTSPRLSLAEIEWPLTDEPIGAVGRE
jgi:hypothetical protein